MVFFGTALASSLHGVPAGLILKK